MKQIIINSDEGEVRAAVLNDGSLTDLFIERTLHPRYAGNIYKGRVENVLPGMQAAFVNVGLEKNVFLYVDDVISSKDGEKKKKVKNEEILTSEIEDVIIPKKQKLIKDVVKAGQEILVQITKDPIGTKGARVITEITLPGRFVVLMPNVDYVGISRRIEDEEERDRLKKIAQTAKPKKMGVIVRTVAQGCPEFEIAADIQFLVKLWKKLQAKMKRAKAACLLHHDYDLVYRIVRDYMSAEVDEIIVDKKETFNKLTELMSLMSTDVSNRVKMQSGDWNIFEEYGIEDEISKALRRKVWLNSGGYLVIDCTEALTVIDVNTGKFIGSTCLSDTVLKTNLEAAKEIARQLRIRNVGGIIIVDFIDMDEESHRKQVIKQLEEATQSDKTKTTVLGFTQLGLVEMTRKKVQQGLSEIMTRSCHVCEGNGRIVSEESLAYKAIREIKRHAMHVDQPAILIEMHPNVAAMLIGFGGANLASVEKTTGKLLYVKGNAALKFDEVKIAVVGSKAYVESQALPVSVGDVKKVLIEEHHASNQKNGIARIEGYVIDVDNAHKVIGQNAEIKIYKVFKTYSKAKLVKEPSDGDKGVLPSAIKVKQKPGKKKKSDDKRKMPQETGKNAGFILNEIESDELTLSVSKIEDFKAEKVLSGAGSDVRLSHPKKNVNDPNRSINNSKNAKPKAVKNEMSKDMPNDVDKKAKGLNSADKKTSNDLNSKPDDGLQADNIGSVNSQSLGNVKTNNSAKNRNRSRRKKTDNLTKQQVVKENEISSSVKSSSPQKKSQMTKDENSLKRLAEPKKKDVNEGSSIEVADKVVSLGNDKAEKTSSSAKKRRRRRSHSKKNHANDASMSINDEKKQ